VLCVIGKVKQFQTLINPSANRKIILVLPPAPQQTDHDKLVLALAGRLSHAKTVTVFVLTVGSEDSKEANRFWHYFVDSGVQTIFEPTEDELKNRLQEETQSEDYSMAICAWDSPFIDTICAATKQPLALAFSAKMREAFLDELKKDDSPDGSDAYDEELAEIEADNDDSEFFPDYENSPAKPTLSRRNTASSLIESMEDAPLRSPSKATISVPALGIVDQPHDSPRARRMARLASQKSMKTIVLSSASIIEAAAGSSGVVMPAVAAATTGADVVDDLVPAELPVRRNSIEGIKSVALKELKSSENSKKEKPSEPSAEEVDLESSRSESSEKSATVSIDDNPSDNVDS